MNTKEKIIMELGKKSEAVWDLIKKSYIDDNGEKLSKEQIGGLEELKKEYLEKFDKDIDENKYRFIIFEQYNFWEDFNGRGYTYDSYPNKNSSTEDILECIHEDYFSDCNGKSEEIAIIDIGNMKAYLVEKETKYTKKEIK